MNLDNPFEVVVYYLLIGGMTYLDYRDRFHMVGTLVYMVIHWTKIMVGHDIDYQVVIISPNHYVILNFQSWDDIELLLGSLVTLTYVWNTKMDIYIFPKDWVTIDWGKWQYVYSKETSWYLIDLK